METLDHTEDATAEPEIGTNGHANGKDNTAEWAARFANRDADERAKIDPALAAELEQEAARRFPGRPMPLVVSLLTAEGAQEAMPKWTNDHRHITSLVKNYSAPGRVTFDVRCLAGTKKLVADAARSLYHGAPNMEGTTMSQLLRLALDRSVRKNPVHDPAFAAAEKVLSGR